MTQDRLLTSVWFAIPDGTYVHMGTSAISLDHRRHVSSAVLWTLGCGLVSQQPAQCMAGPGAQLHSCPSVPFSRGDGAFSSTWLLTFPRPPCLLCAGRSPVLGANHFLLCKWSLKEVSKGAGEGLRGRLRPGDRKQAGPSGVTIQPGPASARGWLWEVCFHLRGPNPSCITQPQAPLTLPELAYLSSKDRSHNWEGRHIPEAKEGVCQCPHLHRPLPSSRGALIFNIFSKRCPQMV